MHSDYSLFCMTDPFFYESPYRHSVDDDAFALSSSALPEDWVRTKSDGWIICRPGKSTLPAQGWKIHVSTTLDAADQILHAVAKFCFEQQVCSSSFIETPQTGGGHCAVEVCRYAKLPRRLSMSQKT